MLALLCFCKLPFDAIYLPDCIYAVFCQGVGVAKHLIPCLQDLLVHCECLLDVVTVQ
jgi:hypothetical protein